MNRVEEEIKKASDKTDSISALFDAVIAFFSAITKRENKVIEASSKK